MAGFTHSWGPWGPNNKTLLPIFYPEKFASRSRYQPVIALPNLGAHWATSDCALVRSRLQSSRRRIVIHDLWSPPFEHRPVNLRALAYPEGSLCRSWRTDDDQLTNVILAMMTLKSNDIYHFQIHIRKEESKTAAKRPSITLRSDSRTR